MYIDAQKNSSVKYITQTMGDYYKISGKEWTMSNSGYVSFLDNNTSDYRVGIKAEKPGIVILTFKLNYYWVSDGKVYYDSPLRINYKITVVENPPSGIKISPITKNIGVGQTFTASYTLTPSDAVTTVTWSSDNKSIATVSSTGTVKGIKAGSTSINVKTANGYSASCDVNVKDATLVIDRSSTTAFVGDVFKLSSTIEYTDETAITWSTEDSSVATVNSSTGEVKAVGLGTTNIIANSSGGLTAKSKVDVIEKNLMEGTVISVSAGGMASLLLKKDHILWACGDNRYGQLGDGTTTNRSTPVKVMDGVAFVSAGGDHSMILKTDGTLWACGYNRYGQLGDGTTTNRSTPVKVMDGVAFVSAGGYHSMILKTDGTLWVCGYNGYGQLGDGTTTNRGTPVKVMDGVASVSAGYDHSMILKTDGTLWACGYNRYGQLGDGTTTNRSTPVKVMDGVAFVSAGGDHSMILKTDGTLWACGYNRYGQLGDGTTTNRSTPVKVMDGVAFVSAGGDHSMILKTDGTLWACGYNRYGQLGDGTTTNRSTPVKVMDGVAFVSAGGYHSMILKTDGTLWACGYNGYGQLGDGSTIDRYTPVQIADSDADTDINQLDNVIYIKNMEARPGNQLVIPIAMKNTAEIRSYQFDLYLPSGVTAAVNSKGRVQATLNRSRLEEDDQHTLGVDIQSDGSIRFLVNSIEEETYPAGDGDILSITVNIAENLAEGEYTLSLRNMKLSETDISKFYAHSKVNSTLSVIAFNLGDINNDGVVDVSDYTGVANHILGKTPAGFEKRAADVDENGVIDVSDYTGIANIILRGNIYGKSEARSDALMKSARVQATDLTDIDNVIYASQTIATSNTATLSICMKNSAEIRSYQFDLYLPDGITAAVNSKGRVQASLNRTRFDDETDHTLGASNQEDGSIRFLIGSLQGDTYPAGDGEIITLKINIDNNVRNGSYPVVIRNQKLSETDIAISYVTNYVESELLVTVSDGIDNVTKCGETETIYNLRGQRLSAPQKGINIVGGRKVVVK